MSSCTCAITGLPRLPSWCLSFIYRFYPSPFAQAQDHKQPLPLSFAAPSNASASLLVSNSKMDSNLQKVESDYFKNVTLISSLVTQRSRS